MLYIVGKLMMCSFQRDMKDFCTSNRSPAISENARCHGARRHGVWISCFESAAILTAHALSAG